MYDFQGAERDFTDGLNPEQREAVLSLEPLLVIAGPGSGKTRVLTHRISHFVQSGTKPWRILAVTFTNKAAAEMRDRLASTLGDASSDVWVSTFHSFCVKLLRKEHELAGLPKSFSIVDTDDAQRVLRRIIEDEGLCATKEEIRALARETHHGISAAKNRMATLRNDGRGSLGWLQEKYQQRLTAMGACDFDDLLLLTVRVLSDSDARQRWAGRFDHVLIDEFQDTNEPQLAIARLLADRSQITAVGDAQQAIYGFRGAHAEAMDEFRRSFPGSNTVVLGQNYRSTQQILDVCQRIIDENGDGAPRLWSENADGPLPLVRECDDDRDEAAWVTQAVRRLSAAGTPLEGIAVLVRTNAMTRPLEESFSSNGIPYLVIGSARFYDRAEVRDALAWLKLSVNELDVVSFERACAAPKRGVGPKAVSDVLALAASEGISPVDAARRLAAGKGRTASGLLAVCEHLEKIQIAAGTDAVEAVKAALAGGVRQAWERAEDSETRLENLDALVSAAADQFGDDTSLEAFLERATLVSAADDTGSGVQVMTAHAAKGREFPVVFVPGLEERLFPHSRAFNSDQELREERRLLFVACSRAEKHLFLSWARRRFLFGKPTDQTSSRFLAALAGAVEQESAPRRSDPWSARRHANKGGEWGFRATRSDTPPPPRPVQASRATQAPRPTVTPIEGLAVGDRVTHPKFGDGTVTALRSRDVTVRFADKERTLALDIAPLRKQV